MLEDARVIPCAITREADSNCVRRAPLRVQGRNQVRVFTSHGTFITPDAPPRFLPTHDNSQARRKLSSGLLVHIIISNHPRRPLAYIRVYLLPSRFESLSRRQEHMGASCWQVRAELVSGQEQRRAVAIWGRPGRPKSQGWDFFFVGRDQV